MKRRLLHALVGAGLLLPLGLAANFALNVVLARVLPVEGYGVFGFVQALSAILAMVATLGFSQSLMRFVAGYSGTGELALLRGVMGFSLSVVGLTAAGIVMVLAGAAALSGDAGPLWWTAALVLPLALDVWRESATRGLHRTAEAIAPRQVVLPLATIAAVAGLQFADIAAVLGTYLCVLLVVEGAALVVLWRRVGAGTRGTPPRWARREWLRVSLPMAGTTLAFQGMARWDVIVVGLLAGMGAAGPYTAAARMTLLFVVVLRVTDLAVAPFFAEAHHGGNPAAVRTLFIAATAGAAAMGIPLFLGVVSFPAELLGIFGEEYRSAAPLLVILAFGQLINVVTGPAAAALNMTGNQAFVMRATVIVSALNLVALAVAVPSYGALGASWVSAISIAILQMLLLAKVLSFLRGPRCP